MANDVALIKDKLDITDVIISAGVELEEKTGHRFVGLCPFHNEKTPSFTVDSEMKYYKCFGCGVSGDIFTFYQEFYQVDFREALVNLAEDAGVELSRNTGSQNVHSIDKKTAWAILEKSWEYYRAQFDSLSDSSPCKEYITQRGMSDNPEWFGYANQTWTGLTQHLLELGYNSKNIVEAGVGIERDGRLIDRWCHRIMLPFIDRRGRVLGFTGRTLDKDDDRKYVNSPASDIFNKSAVLFGIDEAAKVATDEGCIFVVEGQFDVLAMRKAGYINTVASSGTAFTASHGDILRRLVGVDGNIVFCFDGDSAGIKAALKIPSHCPNIIYQSQVVSIPKGHDPGDYVQYNNVAELQKIMKRRLSFVEFVLSVMETGFNMSEQADRGKYIARIEKFTSNIPSKDFVKQVATSLVVDKFFSWDDVSRIHYKEKATQKVDDVEPQVEFDKDNPFVFLFAFLLAIDLDERKDILKSVKDIIPHRYKKIAQKVYNFKPSEWDEGDDELTIKNIYLDSDFSKDVLYYQINFLIDKIKKKRAEFKSQKRIIELKTAISESDSKEVFLSSINELRSLL